MADAAGIVKRRIGMGAVFCVAAYALVVVRLADVSLFAAPASTYQAQAQDDYQRADLVDRNGELLARDVRVYDVYAYPKAFPDPKNKPSVQKASLPGDIRITAAKLAPLVGDTPDRLSRKFFGRDGKADRYVLVTRQASPALRNRILALHLRGIEFQNASKRNYPIGRTAAQVVGVTNSDGHGVSGLERGLDAQIRGHEAGKVVQTSLDMRVQFVLAHETEAAKEKFQATKAGALVMDVRTGEILGMVSLPDFDPNDRTQFEKESARNIMVQDVYELGSVFKVISFALGLEDHTFRLDETFPIGNGFKIDERHTIHEAEKMPATLAARDILAQSSNIGTAQIALRSGGVRQSQFLNHMGLFVPLKTELPESARPLLPRQWGRTETATVSYGHGISVSPLAYAAAAAAVVNGGRKIAPTFLKHPQDARGAQLVTPETSAQMRELLRYVVTAGSGKKADVPGYDVGGKTGSAMKLENGRYKHGALVTSFMAAFPISSPRYLVFVMLDEPKGNAETFGFALAGFTAAPLAGQIVARIAPILGVPMQSVAVSVPSSTAAGKP